MANLRGLFAGYALILLTVHGDGTASGKFLTLAAGFMPLRHNPAQPYDYTVAIQPNPGPTVDGHSPLGPTEAYGHPTWGLLTQTFLRKVTGRQVYVDDEHVGTELAAPDGSWALVHHTPDQHGHPTKQSGPRRLWDELEKLHDEWTQLDCPNYDRFGLTVNRHGDQGIALWLDDPDGPHRWTLAVPRS
jgi:hypothetical protein